MKILILADSRGMWPRERNWPGMFAIKLGSSHEVQAYVSGVNCWLGDLHMMENHLLSTFPGQYFDLIIHQGGWHEGGPCFWPPEIWANITNTPHRKHNPDALTHPIVSLRDGKHKNLYVDRKCEKEIFEVFKKHASRVLLVGLGALRPPNDLEVEYKLGMEHHYCMLETNDVFMKYGHDQVNMPMDDYWINTSTGPDRIHYNAQGSDYLSDYLVRYINRLGTTLHWYLSNSEKCSALYEKALKLGTEIASKTNQGDIVILAKDDPEELSHLFWGCLFYGRIPLIKQITPSQVKEIQRLTDAKLCICEAKDAEFIQPLIPTEITVVGSGIIQQPPSICCDDIAFVQIENETHNLLKITHKAAIEQCIEYGTKVGINKDSKILSWFPLQTNGGIFTSLLLPGVFDCHVCLVNTFGPAFDTDKIVKELSDFKCTHSWLYGNMIKSILKSSDISVSGIDLSALTHLVDTSEISTGEDYTNFLTKFSNLGLNVDAVSRCFVSEKNGFSVTQSEGIKLSTDGSSVSSGRNIPGISILIFNSKDEDISETGEAGRVMIRSGTLTTAETGKFGYVDTGNRGFMQEGELFVTSYDQGKNTTTS